MLVKNTSINLNKNNLVEGCYYRAHLDPTGNWCGHNPVEPRFFIPKSTHGIRPDVISRAISNLKKFYETPSQWLKSLIASRESRRQERSEGRERDADVLGVLLHYTELASLRVGVPQENGEFRSLGMKFIAKAAGWREDSDDEEDRQMITFGKAPKNKGIKRVWRSITNLKEAGYITVHPRCDKHFEEEQDYSGLPAIRRIQPKLFKELGISPEHLGKKREQASKRLKKKYRAYLGKIEQELKKGSEKVLGKLADFTKNIGLKIKKGKVSAQQKNFDFEQEKRRQLRCLEFKQLPENKDLSEAAFYAKYPELERAKWHPRRE